MMAGTCRTDGGALVLNADAFIVGITNINPKRINDALHRIGVEINWDLFGVNKDIQRLLGENRPRNTKSALENWLRTFIINRNRIAHSNTSGIHTSESEINTAIDILSAFAPILAQATEDVLKRNYR